MELDGPETSENAADYGTVYTHGLVTAPGLHNSLSNQESQGPPRAVEPMMIMMKKCIPTWHMHSMYLLKSSGEAKIPQTFKKFPHYVEPQISVLFSQQRALILTNLNVMVESN
jgi:hypothetical protein